MVVKFTNTHIVKIEKYQSYDHNIICGRSLQVEIFIEYYRNSLEDFMQEKRESKVRVEEKFIVKLLT